MNINIKIISYVEKFYSYSYPYYNSGLAKFVLCKNLFFYEF